MRYPATEEGAKQVAAYMNGYRAGIEAAARRFWDGRPGEGEISEWIAKEIRAIAAAPDAPLATECGPQGECPTCRGYGIVNGPPPEHQQSCPRCGGSGLVLDATVNPVPCPECRASPEARTGGACDAGCRSRVLCGPTMVWIGYGYVVCPACGGTGRRA